MTVVGCLGGAGFGVVAGAVATAVVLFASAGAMTFTETAFTGSADVPSAVRRFSFSGTLGFFLPPNIGDQAKPRRGAKFELLSMLFWFSYRSPGESVRCCRSF